MPDEDAEPTFGDELDPEERGWLLWVSPHYRRRDFPAEGLTEEHEVLVFADSGCGYIVSRVSLILSGIVQP